MNKKSNLNEKLKLCIAMSHLEKEENEMKIKMRKIRIITINCIIIIFVVSGIAYAVNYKYNIWKEPIKVKNLEELINSNKKDEIISEQEKSGIVSEELIEEKANQLLKDLGYKVNICNIELKRSYSKTSDTYFQVKTSDYYSSGIEMSFNSKNGELEYFVDRDMENNFNNIESVSEEYIKEKIHEKIKNFINSNSEYQITKIEKIPVHFSTKTREENWSITYSKMYDDIPNDYDILNILLYYSKGKLNIYQYAKYDDGYKFENNQVILNEVEAIEIAKNKDREITNLEINNIEAKIEIRPMNAYIYIQEKTSGKEDGFIEEENKDGTISKFNQYKSERILRKVWNIKIKYDVNEKNINSLNNSKEAYGREYYIDCTTGEIIGGKWNEE